MSGTRSIARLGLVTAAAVVALGVAPAANAAILYYATSLSGLAESPPNASPATGTATLAYDNVAKTFHLHVVFNGLVGNNNAAHIHAPTAVAGTGTAGVATTLPTFTGFPGGVTSGVYDNVYNATQAATYNTSYINNNGGNTAGAEAALAAAIAAGKAYVNIHSTTFGGGEIRGFLQPAPPPCPEDLNNDGGVDGGDLGILLANWGHAGAGDLNGDGNVDGGDLGILLAAWGPC